MGATMDFGVVQNQRNVAAFFWWIVVGPTVNTGLVMLNGYVLFPISPDVDMAVPEQMNAYVAA